MNKFFGENEPNAHRPLVKITLHQLLHLDCVQRKPELLQLFYDEVQTILLASDFYVEVLEELKEVSWDFEPNVEVFIIFGEIWDDAREPAVHKPDVLDLFRQMSQSCTA